MHIVCNTITTTMMVFDLACMCDRVMLSISISNGENCVFAEIKSLSLSHSLHWQQLAASRENESNRYSNDKRCIDRNDDKQRSTLYINIARRNIYGKTNDRKAVTSMKKKIWDTRKYITCAIGTVIAHVLPPNAPRACARAQLSSFVRFAYIFILYRCNKPRH